MDDLARGGQRALEQAIDSGVNCIHSSYEYGTRWLTSKVLKDHPKRKDLYHIIKVNVPEWGEERFTLEQFRRQIEEALRDLHTDQIAVVQHLQRGTIPKELGYNQEGEPIRMKDFDEVTPVLLEAFEKLKDEGKVGSLATFPYTVGFAEKAIDSGSFSGIAAYFDCLETEMLDLFDSMVKQDMGFIGIRPFAGGLLTSKRVDRDKLPGDDRMRGSEWDRLYSQLDELRSQLPEEPADWSEYALRFSIAHPAITTTVVGINTPEQFETALRAAEAPALPRDILDIAHRINSRYRKTYGVKANLGGVPIF